MKHQLAADLIAEYLQEFLDDFRPQDEYHHMGCRGSIHWKDCTCPTYRQYFESKKALKEYWDTRGSLKMDGLKAEEGFL